MPLEYVHNGVICNVYRGSLPIYGDTSHNYQNFASSRSHSTDFLSLLKPRPLSAVSYLFGERA